MNILFFLIIAFCFSAVYSAYTKDKPMEVVKHTIKIFGQFVGVVLLVATLIALLI